MPRDVSRETCPGREPWRADVSRETSDRLILFADLLRRWTVRINLIARSDVAQLEGRHILDSLQLIPFLGDADRAIDLGSGAGFPGLILAIATGLPFTLIEADRRKAAFLGEAARVTAAPVTILAVRIEDAALAPAPLITVRALAPLPRLLALAAPLLAEGGRVVALKGATANCELTEAGREWNMGVQRSPSRTDPGGEILILSQLERIV